MANTPRTNKYKLNELKLNIHPMVNIESILNSADRGVILRGKDIFIKDRLRIVKVQPEEGDITFEVKSDTNRGSYEVKIIGLSNDKPMIQCECPYGWGALCKHSVAALLYLKNVVISPNAAGKKSYDQADTVFPFSNYTIPVVKVYGANDKVFKEATKLAETGNVKQVSASSESISLKVVDKRAVYPVVYDNLGFNNIHTSCTCSETGLILCVHKQAGLIWLVKKYGQSPFDVFKDFTTEKNALLSEYGYSLEDDIAGKFEFKVVKGELRLYRIDTSIHKINTDWQHLNKRVFKNAPLSERQYILPGAAKKNTEEVAGPPPELIYAIVIVSDEAVPGFAIKPKFMHYTKNGFISRVQDLYGLNYLPLIDNNDGILINFKNLITPNAIIEHLYTNGYRKNSYLSYGQRLNEEEMYQAREYVGQGLDTIMDALSSKKVFFTLHDGKPTADELVTISKVQLKPFFVVKEDDEFVTVEPFFKAGKEQIPFAGFKKHAFWFLKKDDVIYKLASAEDEAIIDYFIDNKSVRVKKEYKAGFLSKFVSSLAENAEVEIQLPDYEVQSGTPALKLYLKENGDHLLLIPAFEYKTGQETREVPPDNGTGLITEHEGKIINLARDKALEDSTMSFLRALHPSFEGQAQDYFYLHVNEFLHKGWFIKAFDAIRAHGMEILGQKDLKKLKYNTYAPDVKMRTSSGLDWFDLKIEISFGEQFASLADVRKALMNRQNFVTLGDGTMGILPDEWVQKYAAIFKLGQAKEGNLRVSKLHFGVLDALAAEIDSEAVQREILEKKNKLLGFKEIKNVAQPKGMKAELRDYQLEGFKWLNFLDEFGWGGCLADDMGLGKTLQMLSFLRYQKSKVKKAVSLVVVPPTLVFNWSAEIEKFCPDMKLHVYQGVAREKNTAQFSKYDIVLTTYGTVRSDIEFFKDYIFHYIILDESQAIKNPASQVAKAVKLLKAKNRMVMTGTPLENNTFDLYSQMDFLNPGLLGSQEFFKTEYANPIDKMRDEAKAAELRKLIYPFLLKRTKEEVAKELPAKTETILYCEMGKAQRKVYEAFRKKYREEIMEKISEQGMAKSGFLILEGLLKLRQICDSAALLGDEEDYGAQSAKLDEIIREIQENAGHHKILIFSQFLKMLDMVREHLETEKIPYVYMDGQTKDRRDKVKTFQTDAECRVFLMSLKTGGVGINLTEADYIYLLDPWWNPAVEQQAIDRSHRIGQTKKVFAYKMICKDTIEEKILKLQEKKKAIAGDIISTEAGMLKKLGPKDIEHLFS